MSERRGELRLAIAKGHWALGEYDDALGALERAVADDPGCEALVAFVGSLDADALSGALAQRLAAARRALDAAAQPDDESDDSVPRLSTPTLAELLADQGHNGKALRVAEAVLRRNPEDERARAVRERLRPAGSDRERWIAELERWLRSAKERRSREAHG